MASVIYCVPQKSNTNHNLVNVIAVFNLDDNSDIEFVESPNNGAIADIVIKYRLITVNGNQSGYYHKVWPRYLNTDWNQFPPEHQFIVQLWSNDLANKVGEATMKTQDGPILN